ncbi:hypothetical protein OG533_36545 [Streptomyces sp. NBC_01186]|uniref:hypothetical protein n=1 Tax=Streptomyces sp. NBC_01186 TaxID=2903765 RepID=UPI002E128390|nr:hypothetical protein OG533_36545 [Streptomyces sp. NBC_01186]
MVEDLGGCANGAGHEVAVDLEGDLDPLAHPCRQGHVPVLTHLAVLEPLVLAGRPVDLLGDAVDIVGDDVVEVHRERLTVAHAAPAHQIGDQQEAVVAGGTHLLQLLG